MQSIKVNMSQQDLEQAVLEKVKTFGIPLENRDIKVTFATTRKPAGVSAEVEISAQGEKLAQSAPAVAEPAVAEPVSAEPAVQEKEVTATAEDDGDIDLKQTPETPGFESPAPSKNLFE